jgi:hypothetical protein
MVCFLCLDVHSEVLFCISSTNLRAFIDHTVKNILKRVDDAASVLADFLITSVFTTAGSMDQLKSDLYDEGHTGSLLSSLLPPNYKGCVFPDTRALAKNLPLGKHAPNPLVLALGCLRIFDCSLNHAVTSQAPQCTFSPDSGALFIFGAKHLDRFGPMGFEVMYAVAAGLGGEFFQVCKVRQVKKALVLLDTQLVR